MQKFTKITTGFVCQNYEKDQEGKFVCISQEFVAGDEVDFKDDLGNAIKPPNHKYQPFEMVACNKEKPALGFLEAQLLEACKTITSYTSELLYQMDDQVNTDDIDEVKQAKDAIESYTSHPEKSQRYVIEIASADSTQRPGRKVDKSDDGNWQMVVVGKTAQEVLAVLVEACNDEAVSIENSWLRLKIEGEEHFYG